jgi:mannose-6-phosphate isomerase-like protein (cupin superfamily)
MCAKIDSGSWKKASGAGTQASIATTEQQGGDENDHARPSTPRADTADIEGAKARLAAAGGYEVIHQSSGLEIGVYVLVAPAPDRQSPHADDEVYIVLEGRGMLDVEGEHVELHEGHAVFVPAGAMHQFIGYEQLSVLVIFEKRQH